MNPTEQKDGVTGERSPGEDRASCEEIEKHKINLHSYNGSARLQNVSAPGGRFIVKSISAERVNVTSAFWRFFFFTSGSPPG